jgi:hypothetical protein
MEPPQTSSLSVLKLIELIENGSYQIPQFQRKFVWTTDQAAYLIDSLLKGYPIGTLILWRTKERFLSEHSIGGFNLPSPPRGEPVTYVLDGQQRVTSLFAALKGLDVDRGSEGRAKIRLSQIFLDLAEDEEWVVPMKHSHHSEGEEKDYIAICRLFRGNLTGLRDLSNEKQHFMRHCRRRLRDYKIPYVLMNEASTEAAAEVFARINTRGKVLSTFDVMVAKTFNSDPLFDLTKKCAALNSDIEASRDTIGFGSFSNSTIMQVAAVIIHRKEPSRKNIFDLKKLTLRNRWEEVEVALKLSTEHFSKRLRVPHIGLMPYEALAVPFAYFYANQDSPSQYQLHMLDEFFWRAAFGDRYEAQTDSRIGQDLKRMDKILSRQKPDYGGYDKYFEPDQIEQHGEFRLNDAYIKGLVCLLAFQQPRGFEKNKAVVLEKHSLLRSESKNYHHFFPLAYLKRRSFKLPANHIANITLLSAKENQSIGAKEPEIYLSNARQANGNLHTTLRTHLINARQADLWIHDYDAFFEMRCRELSKAIKKQLVEF